MDVPNLHNTSFGVQMQGSQGLKASSVLWWIVYLNNCIYCEACNFQLIITTHLFDLTLKQPW